MRFVKSILSIAFFLFANIACFAQRTYFSGGYAYSVYICNTKKIQTWGDNYYGQLARYATNENKTIPTDVPSISEITSIDAGLGGICAALTSSGNVLTWGHNFYGELGIGQDCPGVCKTLDADTVYGGETGTQFLENIVAISVGQMHVYALLSTGEVVAWGNNDYGQLGDGTTKSKNTPVYVKLDASTRLSNIIMIAAGGNHGYALTKEGYVYAWGDNQANQLGCGDSENHLYPQYVVDKNQKKISGITSIDGGRLFGLMLRSTSMVYGVGAYKGTHVDKNGIHYRTNNYAEFVTGGETPTYYLEKVEAISAGFSHAMAIINENGSKQVVAWGDNRFEDLFQTNGGQIGNGNTTNTQFYAPVYMKTSQNTNISSVVDISAGCGVSYVQTFNETTNENKFFVCGCNTEGQLGLGDNIDRYFLTHLSSVCSPYCGSYTLGKNKTLCQPIDYDIVIPFSTSMFDITWYKNNQITNNKTNILTIQDTGTYTVKIIDLSDDCPDIESSVTISSKMPNFQLLETSFCSTEIPYKVVGEGTFNWYNGKNGYRIGTGNTINVSKYFCEEVISDSIYQVWVEHENECQPMPLKSIKNCKCNTPAPSNIDTSWCYNKTNSISISSNDSIVWYYDSTAQYPITLNNTVHIQPSESYSDTIMTIYATYIQNRCESIPAEIRYLPYFCEPWYTVSGTVVDEYGNGIENTTVLIYCDESNIATDSCLTSSSGTFTLSTQQCIGKILVHSPSEQYEDTWAGDKTLKQYAYNFFVDATIKYVTITLHSTQTHISDVSPISYWESGNQATIYNLQGIKIDSFTITDINFEKLQTYPLPIVVCISNKQGTLHSFLLSK